MTLIETGRAYFSDFRSDYDSPLAKQIIREFAKLDEEYESSEATDEEDRADRARRGYSVRALPTTGVEREIETPTHLLRLSNDGGKESHKAEVFQK